MDKIIIEKFVQQVKNGDIQLEDIPLIWREKVQQVLDSEGA
jgi:hypothetical protein